MAENDQHAELKIGQKISEIIIYAGISESTGTKMFAMMGNLVGTYQQALELTYHMVCPDGMRGCQVRINEYRDGSEHSEFNIQNNMKRTYVEDPALDDGGWRLPTLKELNQLYQNRDDIGNFSTSDKPVAENEVVWPNDYWSCEQTVNEPQEYASWGADFIWNVMGKNFKTGEDQTIRKGAQGFMRLVYTEKRQLV